MTTAAARTLATHSADLLARIGDDAYQGYTYGYPHKTAYRPLSPPVPLEQLWAAEPKKALDLYIHIPFCEMRCGFCNLFTTVDRNGRDTYASMLEQIDREAEVVAGALGPAHFVRMAIGGGTPTILAAEQLDQLLAMLRRRFSLPDLPIAVEASPETTTGEKLAVLRSHGVSRLSLGVQTFDEQEAKGLGRPQRRTVVERALRLIADAGFETRNIDLIYGGRGQSRASFIAAIEAALAWRPDEICLYPLYVRPLTGLGRTLRVESSQGSDNRLASFRAGRDHLLAHGFAPANMRLFRRTGDTAQHVVRHKLPTEGTVGLGCGARSLTSDVHYSSEYAVGRAGVRQILDAWLARAPASFGLATYGVRLDAAEQRRRHVVLALMETDGVSRSSYRARYGGDPIADHPELTALGDLELATIDADSIRLTPAGLEWSDAIGPWLYSRDMRASMEDYTWR